jgi:ATP-binding cassette, subfamily B, bacterial
MKTVRVWELARYAELDTGEVLERLQSLGHEVSSPLTALPMAVVDRFAHALRAERTGEGTGRRRVHQVARELGLDSRATRMLLADIGVDVASHTSSVYEFDVQRLRDHLGVRGDGPPEENSGTGTSATVGGGRVNGTRAPKAAEAASATAADLGTTAADLGTTAADLGTPAADLGTPAADLEATAAEDAVRTSDPTPSVERRDPNGEGREPVKTVDADEGPPTDPATDGTEATGQEGSDAEPSADDALLSRVTGDLRLIARIVMAVRGQWPRLGALLALNLVATPLMLLQPVPLKVAVDSVIGDQALPGFLQPFVPGFLTASPMRLLLVVALLQILIIAAIQLQSMGAYVLNTATGERITLGFRARMFRHVQRLSLSYHDRRGTWETLYRIEYDAPSLQHTADTVIPFVGSAISLVVILGVTASLDLQLALVALAICPILFWLSRRHIFVIRGGYRELKELETSAMGVVQEVLAAVRVVKAFGREDSESRRFRHRYGASMRAKIRLAVREGSYGLWINVTTAAGTALVLVLGVRNVLAGQLLLGELLVIMAYLVALYGPLEEIAQRVGDLQNALAGAERAFALLDEGPEVDERHDARRLDRARGELEFRDVTFGYDPRRPVLEHVDLHIEAGARVGIVGRTGAGKSTLISLLMRFYDPQHGEVCLDGTDVCDLDLADLRNQFAMMLQEPVLFSTSIGENIRYARPDATDDDVEEAARAADAHDFITRLPDGYETLVGERGMLLSGGERQRVSLARAFLRDAPILILDEPTSSVDRETEGSILEAMERLMAGRTTLMIAHRLSTLDTCDAIIAVADGQVRLVTQRTEEDQGRPPGLDDPDLRRELAEALA